MVPPKTTEATVPIKRAVTPLSKAPNSLEDPTKMAFTDATLPRMASGVRNCKMVSRIIMETPSVTPLKNKATTDSQKLPYNPKVKIQSPKPNTTDNNFMPAFLYNGKCAETRMIREVPMAGAARKIPNPSAPTLRIS